MNVFVLKSGSQTEYLNFDKFRYASFKEYPGDDSCDSMTVEWETGGTSTWHGEQARAVRFAMECVGGDFTHQNRNHDGEKSPAEKTQDFINKLASIKNLYGGDPEVCHPEAESALLGWIRSMGWPNAAAAYEAIRDEVGFWYA